MVEKPWPGGRRLSFSLPYSLSIHRMDPTGLWEAHELACYRISACPWVNVLDNLLLVLRIHILNQVATPVL